MLLTDSEIKKDTAETRIPIIHGLLKQKTVLPCLEIQAACILDKLEPSNKSILETAGSLLHLRLDDPINDSNYHLISRILQCQDLKSNGLL